MVINLLYKCMQCNVFLPQHLPSSKFQQTTMSELQSIEDPRASDAVLEIHEDEYFSAISEEDEDEEITVGDDTQQPRSHEMVLYVPQAPLYHVEYPSDHEEEQILSDDEGENIPFNVEEALPEQVQPVVVFDTKFEGLMKFLAEVYFAMLALDFLLRLSVLPMLPIFWLSFSTFTIGFTIAVWTMFTEMVAHGHPVNLLFYKILSFSLCFLAIVSVLISISISLPGVDAKKWSSNKVG